MAGPCRIREAALPDVAAIAAIERLAFADPWPPQAFHPFLGSLTLVADLDGVVSGYVVARHAADEAEILDLAVHPQHRGIGLASALLDELTRRAMALDVRLIFLEVRESNQAARALYERRGFVAVGRRSRYYQGPPEDALILGLRIGKSSGSA
jgi:ribosomal-protein-alanine N-acetyltransferase